MKKNILFLVVITCATIGFTSCGANSKTQGDPSEVLSKKAYTALMNTYDAFYDFNEGLCKVRKGDYDEGLYGFVDSKGKEVIPCRYEFVSQCVEGMIYFKENDLYGFINRKGEVVVAPTYAEVEDFSEGFARVCLPTKGAKYSWDKMYGFIDKNGEVVVPINYDYAESFSEGLAVVKKNKKYGFINTKGDYEIGANYDDAESFSEGLAFVEKNDRSSAINKEGEVVFSLPENIAPKGNYHDGLALVEKYGEDWDDDDYYGYVDKEGTIVIPCKYDDADDFENGVAQVELNDREFFINTDGEKVDIN